MRKIDLKKELKALYGASAKVVTAVDVPAMTYLMVDGEGDPNTSKDYAAAVEALFTVSYAVKFMVKKGPLAIDYGVMPLEGLWWADDMSNFAENRARWKWTMMIVQPELVTKETLETAIKAVAAKKTLPALSRLRVDTFEEGRCAQTLHVGPFTTEGETIARVHEFIAAHGKELTGKHHEIYLSDIRKAAPQKWRTIIRQPMR